MRTRKTILALLAVAVLGLAFAFSAVAQNPEVTKHPMEITEMPICGQCHTEKYTELAHNGTFFERHRFAAASSAQACYVCHAQSFCIDCHSGEEEIKPSDKFKDAPARSLPHRGDYITQHRIDAKINPAPCFKCHGRQNNAGCKRCHK